MAEEAIGQLLSPTHDPGQQTVTLHEQQQPSLAAAAFSFSRNLIRHIPSYSLPMTSSTLQHRLPTCFVPVYRCCDRNRFLLKSMLGPLLIFRLDLFFIKCLNNHIQPAGCYRLRQVYSDIRSYRPANTS